MMIPSFLRLLQVFEMHRVLGPLVRSMVNMATDIATFLVLCAVFLSAFTITFTLFFSQVNAAYSTYVDSYVNLLYIAWLECLCMLHPRPYAIVAALGPGWGFVMKETEPFAIRTTENPTVDAHSQPHRV